MKISSVKLALIFSFVCAVGIFSDFVFAASYTHPFTDETYLTFTNSADTHTMAPGCDGGSPPSYSWALTVNGVTISGTHNCPPLEPGPTGLTAVPQACGTGQNYLNWDDSLGAASYSIYTYPSGWIGNSIGSNFTHTGSVSSSYKYYVRSNNNLGVQSADSDFVTAVTAAACPSPVVSLSASPTAIGPNGASTLTWTVSGATSCTASGGWTGSKNSGGGSEIVSPTFTTTYNLSCTGPGGTTAATPVTVTHPSGFISASACVISPVGTTEGTSCDSNVSWGAYDFTGAVSVLQGVTSFSSSASGAQVRTVNPDNRSFTLRDGGSTFTASASAAVSCQTGTVWHTTASHCAFLPIVSIDSGTNLIRSGATLSYEVDVDSNFDLTCTVRDGGAPVTFSHTAASSTQTYPLTTRALTSAQIVDVTCTSSLNPVVTGSDEIRVNVIPSIQEV